MIIYALLVAALLAAWWTDVIAVHLGDRATPTGGTVWGVSTFGGVFLGVVLLPHPTDTRSTQ